MTLLEMSASYRNSAAAIHGRIAELRARERAQADPEEAGRLRRRINEPTTTTGAITKMRNTRYESPFDTRASEWIGDLTVWTRQNAGDNSERLERLRRNLRQARERELTPRQRQVLDLYYDRGMTIPRIAEELGLNRSTVSRTLRRARDRLFRYLRYAL